MDLFIVKDDVAKRLDSDIQLTVVYIKIRRVMSGRGFGILTFRHPAELEKESGSPGAIVRKVFGTSDPLCFGHVVLTGRFYERWQCLLHKVGGVVCDQRFRIDGYLSGRSHAFGDLGCR